MASWIVTLACQMKSVSAWFRSRFRRSNQYDASVKSVPPNTAGALRSLRSQSET